MESKTLVAFAGMALCAIWFLYAERAALLTAASLPFKALSSLLSIGGSIGVPKPPSEDDKFDAAMAHCDGLLAYGDAEVSRLAALIAHRIVAKAYPIPEAVA